MQKEATYKVLDYDPFGMQMPARSFTGNSGYKFGFNGMLKESDIAEGNYTTPFRELDTRLGGRWWSQDPIVKPWESPYAGFSNNPIVFSDPSGLNPKDDKVYNGGDVEPVVVTAKRNPKPKEDKEESSTTNPSAESTKSPSSKVPSYEVEAGEPIYSTSTTKGEYSSQANYDYFQQTQAKATANYMQDVERRKKEWRPLMYGLTAFMTIPAVPALTTASIPTYSAAATVTYNTSMTIAVHTVVYSQMAMSKTIGYAGAAYFYTGYKLFGSRFVKIGTNPSMLKSDLGHFYARIHLYKFGLSSFPKVKNFNTIYWNNPGYINSTNKVFSFGVNPWKRTLFHAGPGKFK